MTIAQMFHALIPAKNAGNQRKMSVQEGEARQQRAIDHRVAWIKAKVNG